MSRLPHVRVVHGPVVIEQVPRLLQLFLRSCEIARLPQKHERHDVVHGARVVDDAVAPRLQRHLTLQVPEVDVLDHVDVLVCEGLHTASVESLRASHATHVSEELCQNEDVHVHELVEAHAQLLLQLLTGFTQLPFTSLAFLQLL